MRRRPVLFASILLAGLALAATVEAQFGRGRMTARIANPADFDGSFQFCRIVYRNAPTGDGGGWGVD